MHNKAIVARKSNSFTILLQTPGKVCHIRVQSDFEKAEMPMADYCTELEDVAAKTADVVDDLGERIMAAAYSLVGMLGLLLAQAIATGK